MRIGIVLLCAALASLALGKGPGVSAASAVVIDADTGKVLFSKNGETHRFPASTTKIMTALLLLEHVGPDELITAPSDVENVTGSSLNLKPGEQVNARDMLYALMLRSANDGCYAVAQHIAGSTRDFSRMMNLRAKEIGCTKTNFTNPNGLKDPKHVTSAHDLALMAREALRYPEFAEAVSTRKVSIERTINFEDMVLVNKNKLLAKDPTFEGVKTGYTNPAGHCFVGAATRNGYRIITVVLKSEDWTKDTETLMAWAFKNHLRSKLKSAGETIDALPVANGAEEKVQIGPVRDVFLTVPKGRATRASIELDVRPLEAPVRVGQRVGSIVVRDSDGYEVRIPAVALGEVPPRGIAQAATTGWGFPLVGATLLGTLYARGKSKRRKAIRRRLARATIG